ncbi:hypothetical protein LWI29_019152 [Acer saccharum]|uniref:Uncharacterized protein n=1 Tax=Acer saccharum TaxID=4024 RepID=A0AA39SUH7_ACESA|nr:hypothetical protein LWI29_019152 [Acer saccharum]
MSNNGGHVNSLPALFQMFDTPQHSMPSRGPHLIENQGQSLGSSHNSSSSDSFTPSRVNRDSQPLRPTAVTQQSSSSDMPESPRLNIETQPLSQQNRVDQHNSHRMVTRSMTGSLKPRAFVSDYFDKRVSMCLCLGMRREFDRTSKSSSYPLENPKFSDWLFALEEFSWLLQEMHCRRETRYPNISRLTNLVPGSWV